MPKNENNENLEATQAPAEFTPEAPEADAAEAENVTPIETARKRKLGTGAIVGISAAGVALLAGVFGSGVAVANTIGHAGDRGPVAGMNGQNLGEMAQGGQMPGGQMGDMDGDGDTDLLGTRGNSAPFDGVFWLEQQRSSEPRARFTPARQNDSPEMPLPKINLE